MFGVGLYVHFLPEQFFDLFNRDLMLLAMSPIVLIPVEVLKTSCTYSIQMHTQLSSNGPLLPLVPWSIDSPGRTGFNAHPKCLRGPSPAIAAFVSRLAGDQGHRGAGANSVMTGT